jgi:hypothetical protein
MANSNFLKKHEELFSDLTDENTFSEYNLYDSENSLSLGNFPAIGIFLGTSRNSKEVLSYVPTEYTFIIMTADTYDRDDPADQKDKQYAMFDLIESVIDKFGFNVITDIEPMVSIALGEGGFITGFTTMIKFNA